MSKRPLVPAKQPLELEINIMMADPPFTAGVLDTNNIT